MRRHKKSKREILITLITKREARIDVKAAEFRTEKSWRHLESTGNVREWHKSKPTAHLQSVSVHTLNETDVLLCMHVLISSNFKNRRPTVSFFCQCVRVSVNKKSHELLDKFGKIITGYTSKTDSFLESNWFNSKSTLAYTKLPVVQPIYWAKNLVW